jgi:hypothetical protein
VKDGKITQNGYDSRTQVGDVIVVRPDGWEWGTRECLPEYVVIKLPGVSEEDAKKETSEYFTGKECCPSRNKTEHPKELEDGQGPQGGRSDSDPLSMTPLSYLGTRSLFQPAVFQQVPFGVQYPSQTRGNQVRRGSQPLSGLGFDPLWYPTRNLHQRAHGSGGVRGLGLAPQAKSIIVSAPSIAGGILTAGGSASIAAAAWGLAAIPIIGAVVAGVTIGLTLLFNRKGPQQKIASTKIVDAIENGFVDPNTGQSHPGLKQNLVGYFTGPRTESARAQAIQNFQGAWQYVQSHCAELGEPGERCVNDRQAGACKWIREAGSEMTQYDGIQPGQCFNWDAGYLQPLLRDVPNPDPVLTPEGQQTVNEVMATIENITGGSGGLLLIGAAALFLAAMAGGK